MARPDPFADIPITNPPATAPPREPRQPATDPFVDIPITQPRVQQQRQAEQADPFANIPLSKPSRASNKRQLTFLGALKAGLARGSIGVAESVAGTFPRYIGEKIDSDTLQAIGKSAEQFWGEMGAEYEPPPEIQGSIIDNPALLTDSSWWAYNVGNIAPSIAAAFIPGGAAFKAIKVGGRVLKWNPATVVKLARLGGAVTGGLAGGGLEGAATYREVIRRGGSEQEAARAAELMTLASAGLNALPIGRALRPGGTFAGKFLATGAIESLTEWLEEPAEALILGDDVLEAMKQGANVIPPAFLTGGLLGGAVRTRAPKLPEAASQSPEAVEAEAEQQMQQMQAGEQYKGFITGEEILKRQREFPKDTVIRREQILKPLMEDLGVPLYQGRVRRGKNVVGYYKRGKEEVRVRNRNDLEVTAHEIAHLLDDRDAMFRKGYRRKEFRKEIKGVSYDVKSLSEGFAEFMRLFLTQETEAVERAPKFYDWFTNTIKGTEYETTLLRAQQGMHDWFEQGALQQFKSKLGEPPQPVWQRFRDYIRNWRDKSISNVFDALHGVKLAEKELRGSLGDADISPYKSFRLLSGVRMAIRAVYEHGTIGWRDNGDIKFTGDGLRHVFEDVSDQMEDVLTYFAGRRAAELMKQGREKLFTKVQIDAALNLGKQNPAFVQAFERWQAFNSRILDFAQQSGLISKDTRKQLDDMGKDYVPFYRVVESITGEKIHTGNKPFQRLRGGTANVNDILDNIATNAALIIDASFKNVAKQKFYDMLDRSKGGAKYATRTPPDIESVLVSKDQVIRKMKEMGVERIPKNIEDMVPFLTFGHAPKGSNFDVVMRNGKPNYYEVADPLALKAMQSLGPKSINIGLRILGGFKRLLTRLVTADPGFMLVNLIRDTGSAYLLGKSPFVPFVDSLRGFTSRMLKDDAYWDAMANGIGFSSFIHGETGVLRRDIEQYYTKRGIDYKTVLDTPQKLLDFWDEFGSGFEYGARLQEYKNLRNRGASMREAAFAGREVSTDFAMRGSSDFVRFFTMTVPFLGARLQGLYRLSRAGAPTAFRADSEGESAARLAIRGILGITLPTLGLLLLNQDDERYNALPDWIKDLHWVIFVPGRDEPFLIPKPFELGAMFATIPERFMELVRTQDGEEFADAMLWIIGEQMELKPIPQVIRPLYDIGRNATFTGSPVIPEDLKDVAPFEQYRPWTSETMVALGEYTKNSLKLSPLKLETMMRGYFGTLGTYLLQASDAIVRGAGDNEAPTRRLDEIPVVKRLVRSAPYRHTSYEDDFYKVAEEVRETVATLRKITAEGRAEDAKTFMTDKERRLAFGLEKATNQVKQDLAKINRALRIVRLNRNLNAEQKRLETDKLLRVKNRLLRQATLGIKQGQKQFETSR